jgi:hypothetical protein
MDDLSRAFDFTNALTACHHHSDTSRDSSVGGLLERTRVRV